MKIKNSNSLKTFVFMLCSLSLLAITAGKCKKTNTTVANPIFFTIKFDTRGGSAVDSIRVASGSKVTRPADPARNNYTFEGWYKDEALTQMFDFNTPITENITLYARWKIKDNVISYTVAFNTNGGSTIKTDTVALGDKVPKPTDPTRMGYIFQAWYSDQALTKTFDFNTPITQNITLYAKWLSKDLQGILEMGTIPSNLADYDTLSGTILQFYKAGANVVGIYVIKNGTGDGTSWAKARGSVKSALESIADASDNKVYLVMVGAGVYNESDAMAMKNNVAIIGGWPAAGGWMNNPTNLTEFSGSNTHRVFNNSSITNTALLYGVSVTNGQSPASPFGVGGGIYNDNASPILINVMLSGNKAELGGGMYNRNSSPILMNITFSGNMTTVGAGGGMYNFNAFPKLMNVTFANNTSETDGGGVYNRVSSSITLINVTFSGNTAKGDGGGIYNTANAASKDYSTSLIFNSIFWGNTATTNAQYTTGTDIYNSVVENGGTSNGNNNVNPTLITTLSPYSGYVSVFGFTGTSPDNIGLYVKMAKNTNMLYYSIDGTSWYTNASLTTAATVPADAIDITVTDATGYPRTGRPDAGAWEHR